MNAPRILVVEDERIVALHLRQQLINLGYEVPETVASGDHALREVEASPPDLVLMDINLEGALDGIATAARIPASWRIPVIYLTAYSEEATLARASATNAYGYLLKPFSERELHAMIQVTLARSRSERAADAAEKCRRQTEKMAALGELAAEVAVDFDQLLNIIYGQLELVGDRVGAHPELASPIEQTFEEAIEKERLMRQLLAFSGRQKLTPETVSLPNLVTNGINALLPVAGQPMRIRVNLPAELWRARIDPGQLAKALTNIAMNARDAMPNGGELTITAQNIQLDQDQTVASVPVTSGDYVLLVLSDNGEGMPEHVLQRVFEPFFTTKPGTDGLGLSLVFGFIRQSNGQISIDSKEGGGTTVRLWLPAMPEHAPTETLPCLDAPAPRFAGDMVDDGRPDEARAWPSPAGNGRYRGLASAPANVDPDFKVPWHRTEGALFASIALGDGEVRYRLIAEPLPRRDGWDWTVWRPDDNGQEPRHGRATSLSTAMAAAEAAARLWESTESSGAA